MAVEEPYGIVEGQELEQGDFILNCPVIIPEYISRSIEEKAATPGIQVVKKSYGIVNTI